MQDEETPEKTGTQDRPIVEHGNYTIAECEGCGIHVFSIRGFPSDGILIARCCQCDMELQFLTVNITKYGRETIDA